MKKLLLLCVILLLYGNSLFAQNETKKTALLWDASYGMVEKDLSKEFAFLDSYFNRNPEVNIHLKVFSNTVSGSPRRARRGSPTPSGPRPVRTRPAPSSW